MPDFNNFPGNDLNNFVIFVKENGPKRFSIGGVSRNIPKCSVLKSKSRK